MKERPWRSVDDATTPAIASISRDAARRILDAIDQLDALRRSAFLWDASVDSSSVLSGIADAFRQPPTERLEGLARSLYADARFFDGVEAIQALGDVEPWLTIRQALWDVVRTIDLDRPDLLCGVARQHSVRNIPRP